MAIHKDSSLLGIVAVAPEKDGGKVKAWLIRLLSEFPKFDCSTQCGELLCQKFAHSHYLRTEFRIGRDRWNCDGGSES